MAEKKSTLSSVEKQKNNAENILPKTCNDVFGLKADSLKKLCKKFNIPWQLPKKGKCVFLCDALGISTTGKQEDSLLNPSVTKNLSNQQIEEYEHAIKPQKLCQRTDFTKNLLTVPDVEEADVKKYLLNTKVISSDAARAYKISRPYQLKQFVHSVRYSECPEMETFCVISALCNPSQSTNADEVKVVFAVLDKITGMPYGGFCTCTVGFSLTCGHIGATLFRLCDLVASGVKEDHGLACTDVLCEWTNPKGAAASATIFDELKIRKKEKNIRRTTGDFGKKIVNPSPPEYDAVLALKANLLAATHHLKQYCPAIQVLNPTRFCSNPPPPPPLVSSLPDQLSADNPLLVCSAEVSITSTPLPISSVPHTYSGTDADINSHVDIFLKNIHYSEKEREAIEELTRGQSNNLEWYQQRKGAISASKLGRVLRVAEKETKCDSLVRDIVGYKVSRTTIPKTTVPALKWGTVNEKKAREAYVNKFKDYHSALKVEERGLMVHDEHHYIRVSPDGVIQCKCHADRLIEIKCPYASRDMTIEEGVSAGKITYLETVNGHFQLKKRSSEGYYAQIQGLMAVMKLSVCHFVIWTKADLKVITVPFDASFWRETLLPACEKVFRQHIVPEILTGKLNKEPRTQSLPRQIDAQPATATDTAETQTTTSSKQQISKPRLQRKTHPRPPKRKNKSPHTASYQCGQCAQLLPEEDHKPDNSNASVGCDCQDCGCDVWFCWPCAGYNEDIAENKTDWYCPKCVKGCSD